MTATNVTTAIELPPVWDDCSVQAASSVNPTGPDGAMTVITDPAGYLGALQADAVGESCTVTWQLNHKYRMGTDVHPHIHVVRNDGSDNAGDVEFQAKFRHLPLRGDASAWTGWIDGTKTLQPEDGADKTGLILWSLSDATYSFGISSQIMAIIKRSALATGSVAVTSCDVHAQLGQHGSDNEGSL